MSRFFGLPFLPVEDVEDAFTEDIVNDTPKQDNRCLQFEDYVFHGYILNASTFPPSMWAEIPDEAAKRTNNGAESFHAHFNAQFYSKHLNIFIFVDVLKQIQTATYIQIRSLNTNG